MPCAAAAPTTTLISKCSVYPDQNSRMQDMKLSASDLPMLSCHYIQKGCLFERPPHLSTDALIALLKRSLSQTLSSFPPLAGRLITDGDGRVYVTCNDAGVDFLHADASGVSVGDVLSPIRVPEVVKGFFPFDGAITYAGHYQPITAVQVTELSDGVFIGCVVNHAVADGTSYWNFFNTFAEFSRGVKRASRRPDFSRDSVLMSQAVLRLPEGGPKVRFNEEALSERIFSFSREAILRLKTQANKNKYRADDILGIDATELMGKQSNDPNSQNGDGKAVSGILGPANSNNAASVPAEISSFQSLSALFWLAVTRARKLSPSKTTTFRMAVNCRHRLNPRLDPLYFGNAIQSIPTYASAGDLLSRGLPWAAEQLNKNVNAYDSETVRRFVEDWEKSPSCFLLGNFDGASMTMGSSPRFPMYDNDFGWGRPLAIRSGRANKFDGKISAFPGRAGGGSVDLEVVLAPETMAAIESDLELMQYVSSS